MSRRELACRHVVRDDSGVHDPDRRLLRKALRVGILLPLVFVLVEYGFGMPNGSLFAAFAVNGLLGFADFGGPLRDRFWANVVTGCIGLGIVLIGSLAGLSPAAAVITGVVITWAATFAGVLRGYVGSAGIAITIALAIALTADPSLAAIPDRLVGWATGAAFALLGGVLLWPTRGPNPLRVAVAEALAAAAAAVRSLWPAAGREATPGAGHVAAAKLADAVTHVHAAFDGRVVRPGDATGRERSLLLALDEIYRLTSLISWASRSEPLSDTEADQELSSLTATALEECSLALTTGSEPPMPSDINAARERHWRSMDSAVRDALDRLGADQVVAAASRSFKIRLAALQSQMIANDVRGTVRAEPDPHPEATLSGVTWLVADHRASPWQVLRDQFTLQSPWFRTSIRTGLAIGLGVLVVGMLDLQHGFWVLLGTITALRMDAVTTWRTALQSFAGTVVGFLVGVLGIYLAHGDATSAWIALPIVTFLATYTPGAISMFVGQAAFTVFVIVLFALYDPSRYLTAEIRVTDITVGLAISAVVSALMWPNGVVATLRGQVREGLMAAVDYLVAVYDRAAFGSVLDPNVQRMSAVAETEIIQMNETFDLACAQSGRNLTHANQWTSLTNIANELCYTAGIVVSLSRIGTFDAVWRDARDSMLLAAERIRVRILASSEGLGQLSSDRHHDTRVPIGAPESDSRVSDGLDAVHGAVLACLERWRDDSDDHVGQRAAALVWAQEWLVHSSWLADQLEQVLADAT